MLLILGLSLGLGTEPHQISSTETYALSDNRIIDYRGDFCQDLRTSSIGATKYPESMATGYLYFLRSRPQLKVPELFNASVTADLNSNLNFRYWNFYLNAGSGTKFTVCYPQRDSGSRNVIFYIIRETGSLNEWIEEPSDQAAEKTFRLTSQCDTIVYEVDQDNMYYFVFYLSGGGFGSVTVDFYIDRLLYDVQPDNIVHQCSFALDGSSNCALSAGMNTPYTAVLSLNASRPIDYAEDGAEIRISCQPRAWLYVVIVLVVVFVGIIVFLCGLAVCVKIALIFKKKQSAKKSQSQTTSAVGPGASASSVPAFESSFSKHSSASYPKQTAPPGYDDYPPPPAYS